VKQEKMVSREDQVVLAISASVVLSVLLAKTVLLDLTVKTDSEGIEANKVRLESVDKKDQKEILAVSVNQEMDLLNCDKLISTKFHTKKVHLDHQETLATMGSLESMAIVVEVELLETLAHQV